MANRDALSKASGRPHSIESIAPTALGELIGVSLTDTNILTVYTGSATKIAVISYVMVVCTGASAVTTPPVAKVTTGAVDVFPAQALIGLEAVNKVWMWPMALGASKIVPAGQTLNIEIVTASVSPFHYANFYAYGYEM